MVLVLNANQMVQVLIQMVQVLNTNQNLKRGISPTVMRRTPEFIEFLSNNTTHSNIPRHVTCICHAHIPLLAS